MDTVLQIVFDWLAKHANQEMTLVTGAPIAFAVCLTVLGTALFYVMRFYFRHDIASRDTRIQIHEDRHRAKDEQIQRMLSLTGIKTNGQFDDSDLARLKEIVERLQIENEARRQCEWQLLSDTQKAALTKALQRTGEEGPFERTIELLAEDGFPDVVRLSDQLYEVFKIAGWTIKTANDTRIWNNIHPGIRIDARKVSSPCAQFIGDTLSEVFGPDLISVTEAEMANIFTCILIGRKP